MAEITELSKKIALLKNGDVKNLFQINIIYVVMRNIIGFITFKKSISSLEMCICEGISVWQMKIVNCFFVFFLRAYHRLFFLLNLVTFCNPNGLLTMFESLLAAPCVWNLLPNLLVLRWQSNDKTISSSLFSYLQSKRHNKNYKNDFKYTFIIKSLNGVICFLKEYLFVFSQII